MEFEQEENIRNLNKDAVTVVDSGDENDQSNTDKEQLTIVAEGDIFDLTGSLMGLKREKIDDLYDLYCKHAHEVGFSVRKSTSRYNGVGAVIEKYFLCSCEGCKRSKFTSSSSTDQGKRRKTTITRTNCSAALRVKLNEDGLYEVVNHNTIHNHALTRKEWNHLHRSERSITSEKTSGIDETISSGMKASDSFGDMAKDVGGEEFVGHMLSDHINFANRVTMSSIKGGDAQTLIDSLYQHGAEDPEFFFRVKLDDDGRLSNVFWRDSMMKEDFMIYGDVVVFDTTYRTNQYNLICGLFVGLNNHKKNVMFGCALITDEKIESFEWLFEIFKKSMHGKSPVSIFTDQDLAIENAVAKVFPDTRHRLCLWHLHQNAISRFGTLKGNNCFKDHFNKCLYGCSSEEEFEYCWSSMILTYGLKENTWFQRIHHLRDKWSTGLNKGYFSAGILSLLRSESINTIIELKAKKTTSLKGFYDIFNSTVQRWRSNERLDEFVSTREIPESVYPITGILKHASKVYTLTLFKEFEEEVVKTLSTTFKELHEDANTILYNVMHEDGHESYDVVFHASDKFISCTCKKFEECGILCHHCLRVYHLHSIVEIPDCYIKRRWTKNAKKELWNKGEKSVRTKDWISWRHQMVRKYYNLVQRAQENEEARRIIEDGYVRVATTVEALKMDGTLHSLEESDISSSSVNVLDPALSVTKGRRRRTKENLQNINKKKTNDTLNSNESKELSSKTPNPSLF